MPSVVLLVAGPVSVTRGKANSSVVIVAAANWFVLAVGRSYLVEVASSCRASFPPKQAVVEGQTSGELGGIEYVNASMAFIVIVVCWHEVWIMMRVDSFHRSVWPNLIDIATLQGPF